MLDRRDLPPGPSASPYAQMRKLVADPYGLYTDAYRDHGPIFTLRVLGQEPWVILGDPEAVRTVFRASADEALSGSEVMRFLLGPDVLLFRDGERHRKERRIMTPPFKHERMARYAERMLARTDEAFTRLQPGAKANMVDVFQEITLRVIVECIFGVTSAERRERLSALFVRHLDALQTPGMAALSMTFGGDRVRAVIEMGTRLRRARAKTDGPLPNSRVPLLRFLDTHAELEAMLQEELEACRRDPGDRDDILALLASAAYDDGSRMSDQALLDELVVLVVGGHETSAITLAWATTLLLENPTVLVRLRAELDEAFGDGPVVPCVAERLPYLGAVIDETLRIRPVAASIPRRLAEDAEIGGHRLRKGTRVNVAPAVLHFRDDLWPDAQAFRPERFLGARPSPFQFLPFGGGSRACLGRPFAQLEMKLVLAELVRRFELRASAEASTIPALRGLLTGPSDRVPVVVERVRHGDGAPLADAAA